VVKAATIDTEEQNFVDVLNNYRKTKGLTELKINQTLSDGAKFMAQDFSDHPNENSIATI